MEQVGLQATAISASSLALAFVPIPSCCSFVATSTSPLLSAYLEVPGSLVTIGVRIEASLVVAASTVFGASPVSPLAPSAISLVGVTGIPVAPTLPGVLPSPVSGSMPSLWGTLGASVAHEAR